MVQVSTSHIMIILSLLNAAMFVYSLAKRRRKTAAGGLALVSLLALQWCISITLRSLTTDPATAIVFHEAKFIGAALLPVAVLVIVAQHIGWDHLVLPKNIALFSIIPLLTILISQTNSWHHLFRREFHIIYQPDGTFFIDAVNNYWFYVHSIYSYTLWGICIFLLLKHYFRKSNQNRLQTGIYLVAIIFPVVTNIIDLMGWVKAYDLTIFAFTASIMFFVYAVFFYSAYDLIPLARIKLVDSLPNPIFIYNREYQLTDANHAAVDLAGISVGAMWGQKREVIMQTLPLHPMEMGLPDYWVVDLPERKNQVMSLESQTVPEANSKIAGFVDIFTDVTALEKAKKKIEKIAVTDKLTGLYNRTYFEEIMRQNDEEKTFPLALIMGDVDGLKVVNDTYGHAAGDELIRRAAAAMKNAVRSDDMAARIGGDEFVIILENVQDGDILRILEKIKSHCKETSNDVTPLSICLGYYIRQSPDQPMEEVFRLADQNMYSHKGSKA